MTICLTRPEHSLFPSTIRIVSATSHLACTYCVTRGERRVLRPPQRDRSPSGPGSLSEELGLDDSHNLNFAIRHVDVAVELVETSAY
jgi:hypothetical protein